MSESRLSTDRRIRCVPGGQPHFRLDEDWGDRPPTGRPDRATAGSKIARLGDRIHVGVFLSLIWLPLAAGLLGWRGRTDLAENRALAPAPRIGVDPLATLTTKFDRYYSDHFGLRNELILAHDLIKVKALGVYQTDQVAVGRDQWLFFIGDRVLEDYEGIDGLTNSQLQAWQEVLEGRQAWLAQRGIACLFVVAPNKESIYPDRLPDRLRRPGVQTRFDQLLAHLRRHSTAEILDLRGALRAARQSGEVYFPLDTHWNDRGALVAYREICAWLQKRLPGIAPLAFDDFQVARGVGPSDLCAMAGWHGVTRECELLVPRRPFQARQVPLTLDPGYSWPTWTASNRAVATQRPGLDGRLVLFHDSFMAQRARDYLAEHFGRMVSLPMRSNFQALDLIVRQERPQVVIEEWVERTLIEPPANHPQWIAARREAEVVRR